MSKRDDNSEQDFDNNPFGEYSCDDDNDDDEPNQPSWTGGKGVGRFDGATVFLTSELDATKIENPCSSTYHKDKDCVITLDRNGEYLSFFFLDVGKSWDVKNPCISKKDEPPQDAAICVNSNKLYICGGKTDKGFVEAIQEIVINWSSNLKKRFTLRAGPVYQLTDIPGRKGHTLVSRNGTMYLFGGQNSKWHLNDLYSIRIRNNGEATVVELGNNTNKTPRPRSYHTCIIHENSMLLAGGRGTMLKSLSSEVWKYNILYDTWDLLGSMTKGRVDFGMVCKDNMLLIFDKTLESFSIAKEDEHNFRVDDRHIKDSLGEYNVAEMNEDGDIVICSENVVCSAKVDRPVRIAVVGLIGKGKSSNCNAFVLGPGYKRYNERGEDDNIKLPFPEGRDQERVTFKSSSVMTQDIEGDTTEKINGFKEQFDEEVNAIGFQHSKGVFIEIIDTPGLSDTGRTKGKSDEDKIKDDIKRKLRSYHLVDALVYTLSTTLMTNEDTFALKTLAEMFGKDKLFQSLFVFKRRGGTHTEEDAQNKIKTHVDSEFKIDYDKEKVMLVDSRSNSEKDAKIYESVILHALNSSNGVKYEWKWADTWDNYWNSNKSNSS